MPSPLPISKEVITSIEDLIDQSRLAGFNHGYEVGFSEGLKVAMQSIEELILTGAQPKSFIDEVREDLGLSDEPTPMKEMMGWVIEEPSKPAPKQRKKRLVSVKALGLSTKTQNALENAGITKVKQLTEMSAVDLRKLPRIGAGSVKEIASVLKKHGRSLKA